MRRGKNDGLVLGTNNAISDISGRKFKAKDMRLMDGGQHRSGWFVHKSEWYPTQPQDTIKAVQEHVGVVNARTESQSDELLDPPITDTLSQLI